MTGGGEETKNLFGLVGTKQRQIDNRPMQAYPRAQAYAGQLQSHGKPMQNRLGTTMGLLVISEQKSFANLFSTHKCRISASAKTGILIHSCIQTLNRRGGGR